MFQGPSSCKKAVLRDQHEVLRDIGHGGFGQIKLAHHWPMGAEVAVKVLPKTVQNLPVLSEPDMMRSLEHPNVIQLFQVVDTHRNIYMVMEHAGLGQLLDHVPQHDMQEKEACRLFQQIVCAMGYCHDKGIMHHDLKPENIILDARGHIKLIHFGFSTTVTPGQKLHKFWGTLSHFAPEIILRQAYEGPPVDIWSLGVILYFMLTGRCPFMGPTAKEVLRQIVLGTYHIPPCVSVAAQILTCQILTLDPRKRPTAKQILQHPWLIQGEQYLPHDYDAQRRLWAGPQPACTATNLASRPPRIPAPPSADTSFRPPVAESKSKVTSVAVHRLRYLGSPVRPQLRSPSILTSAAGVALRPAPLVAAQPMNGGWDRVCASPARRPWLWVANSECVGLVAAVYCRWEHGETTPSMHWFPICKSMSG
uniref:sperm motility kinase 2B-like n=1 Tax=Urocitellus parryii TaxID=9999 RepID=UPI000E55D21A|nr:sperm motility kinase 2B-like [Urocitellus parryii]